MKIRERIKDLIIKIFSRKGVFAIYASIIFGMNQNEWTFFIILFAGALFIGLPGAERIIDRIISSKTGGDKKE